MKDIPDKEKQESTPYLIFLLFVIQGIPLYCTILRQNAAKSHGQINL